MKNDNDILKQAGKIIDIELKTVRQLKQYLDAGFTKAVKLIYGSKGKVVVTGMGKSGIIGRKISSTLASTGTSSAFLHPGEAIHGDLGIVCGADVVLLISNSGETPEILRILPFLKKMGVRTVALTSGAASSLALQSDVVLRTGPIREADPFGLIPSSSAAAALVLGDALAFTLLSLKGFQREDYAFYHPGGNLGKRLLLRVRDVMQTGKNVPLVGIKAGITDALKEINRKNAGFALVEDRGKVAGIITDGDLRRLLVKTTDLTGLKAGECMTPDPMSIEEEKLAVQAMAVMEKHEITCLVIKDKSGRLKGFVHLHDLLGKQKFNLEE